MNHEHEFRALGPLLSKCRRCRRYYWHDSGEWTATGYPYVFVTTADPGCRE